MEEDVDEESVVVSDEIDEGPAKQEQRNVNLKCGRCETGGNIVGAVKHCEECNENFCESCIIDHNSFRILQKHNIVACSELDLLLASTNEDAISMHTAKRRSNSETTFVCGLHEATPLSMLCMDCDQLCCQQCSLDHTRNRHKVDNISTLAQGVRDSSHYKDLFNRLGQRLEELENLYKARIADRCRIIASTTDISVAIIYPYVASLNKQVHTLKERTCLQLQNRNCNFLTRINNDVDQIDILTTEVKGIKDVIEDLSETEMKTFIRLRNVERNLQCSGFVVSEIKDSIGKEQLKFTPNLNIRNLLSIETLGKFSSRIVHHGKKYFPGTVVYAISMDKMILAVTCKEVESIIKTDSNLLNEQQLLLPKTPNALCTVDKEHVAVSFPSAYQVALVCVKDQMSIHKIIDINCWPLGIAYSSCELYVTTKGYVGGACVYVFDKEGVQSRAIYKNNGKNAFKYPTTIMIDEISGKVYICDKKRLFEMDKSGKDIKTVRREAIQKPIGLCLGKSGQMYVCCGTENGLLQIDTQTGDVVRILGDHPDVTEPKALCFDEERSRLMIMSDTHCVQIFDIN